MHSVNICDLAILLIEPSNTQLKVILQHLLNEGVANIEGVVSGKDAINSLQHHRPDLIISSLYLPDMTAIELIGQIKHDESLSQIPFMLISSESSFQILDAIRQAGVVAILPKPFAHQDLKNALRATIEYIDPQEIDLEHYDIRNVRVLVVDDSNLARKHICRVLNNMGIQQITQAVDGQKGAELFARDQDAFDLIVTDLNMPIMDGQAMIQYIRKDLDNAIIPILMVTSEDNETRLSNVYKAGVSGICDKPFDPQTVKEMLFRVFEAD
ncbi:MAG: response regulator [Methylomonas sp.]|jgi:two-component system chemotaxis response regulator CheY|uniref:response regulator n=1 Tax=Methylomonas sp. TaxID=418 RepID=UPI0025E524A7|nr:response regulator [Methylomonas sp.]MCK9604922.1 response regulator [Methylomonas sp.]